jgi:hypothetical protein
MICGLRNRKPYILQIEPDRVAFGALTRNFPDGQLVNSAGGKKPGTLPLFLNPSTGDRVDPTVRRSNAIKEVCDGTWQEVDARGIGKCAKAVGFGLCIGTTDAFTWSA